MRIYKGSRWKVWPVIFLFVALMLIWLMFKLATSILMAAAILGGALLLAGVAQRISFYMRRGRPRLHG